MLPRPRSPAASLHAFDAAIRGAAELLGRVSWDQQHARRDSTINRQFYLDLAASGLRMPIGADLVLHEHADPDAILLDGHRLGTVVEEAARRYETPLAIPLMDLAVEKSFLLSLLDVPPEQIDTFHFAACPTGEEVARIYERLGGPLTPRLQANVDAVAHVARNTDRVPVAMCIGPFSLMTKLLADPIGPVYLAGAGATASEEPEVEAVEVVLELATQVILRSLSAQFDAGARAVMVAEPAANKVYISPKQIAKGSDIFERFVMTHNRRIQALAEERGADLVFHCCGELVDSMVSSFATMRPAVLNLGSSRVLWEDAALVPKDVVLFGNLPSKRFYSDELISRAEVEAQACELLRRMKEVGHPFILGSECDVLSVPGHHTTIVEKVDAFIHCPCA